MRGNIRLLYKIPKFASFLFRSLSIFAPLEAKKRKLKFEGNKVVIFGPLRRSLGLIFGLPRGHAKNISDF